MEERLRLWNEDLKELIDSESGQWWDDEDVAQRRLFDLVGSWLRRSFEAGHKQGALASMAQLPQDVQDRYEFDASLDKFHAEAAFRKWEKGDVG
jgi:hypothetical protein